LSSSLDPSAQGNFFPTSRVPLLTAFLQRLHSYNDWRQGRPKENKEQKMDGTIIGLVAVIMSLGIPLGAMYTYYRVRKLRTEERLAAIARGVSVPLEPELSQAARSRRWGILFVCGGLGFLVALGLIAQIDHEPDTWSAAVLGIIPFAIGVGYFLDFTLIRRDLQAS
jgi:hypothetical protein